MIVIEKQDPALYARVQERNLVRQYDLLTNCIEIGLLQGHTSFDKYVLWALNHVAVANISQLAADFDRTQFTLAITYLRTSKTCRS